MRIAEIEEGLNNLRQEHEALRVAFGNDHGMVLMAALKVANYEALSGDNHECDPALVHYISARWTNHETYNRPTSVFGEAHPDALAAALNLAVGQKACGDMTLVSFQIVLGADDPMMLRRWAQSRLGANSWHRFSETVEIA